MPKPLRRRDAYLFLELLRREDRRRVRAALARERAGDPWAIDGFLDSERPFLNGLCLLLLVNLWHDIERDIVGFAARTTANGGVIQARTYRRRLIVERQNWWRGKTREGVIQRLGLNAFPIWKKEMKTLQLLANCYKHDPRRLPERRLLRHLKLRAVPKRRPLRVDYAPLPESDHFRAGLAKSLGLPLESDYFKIVEAFLNRSELLLEQIEQQPDLARVKWAAVSLLRFQG